MWIKENVRILHLYDHKRQTLQCHNCQTYPFVNVFQIEYNYHT